LRAGESLSTVTLRLAAAAGIAATVLPATDEVLRTWLDTPYGTFSFQQWFVARGHRDPVDRVRFEGAANARPAPGVVDALHEAEVVLIAPSNPHVSIGPILAVDRIRRALERRRVPSIAVSPLIGGRAVKGPAGEMVERLQGGTTPGHVADCYEGLIDALVFDEADAVHADAVAARGVRPVIARTLMSDADARRRLAEAVLDAMAVA
jgi:LPPG:FO 2-phospho-L-lactate transferase